MKMPPFIKFEIKFDNLTRIKKSSIRKMKDIFMFFFSLQTYASVKNTVQKIFVIPKFPLEQNVKSIN